MANSFRRFITIIGLLLAPLSASAEGGLLCDPSKHYCGGDRSTRSPSTAAYPSNSGKVTVNPSAVPTTKQIGVELIAYKGVDAGLITGTGRIGAAISPTGSEETFFGPPGFEVSEAQLERRLKGEKYTSQKVGLSTAFNLFSNGVSGVKHGELNIGLIGKYNRATGSVWPGGGISAIIGPISLGYAVAKDEYLFDYTPYPGYYFPDNELKHKFRYGLETFSVGLSLSSLSLDYSLLRITSEEFIEPATVALLVGSLTISKLMLTVGARTERSDRLFYDPQLKTLVTKQMKNETFLGAQLAIAKPAMLGIFYNYYTMREVSLGFTLFL